MAAVHTAARRIGLLGGSFDPVHVAHVALAHSALHHLALDEIRWVPVGEAWQKARALTPAVHRVAMVQLAIAHEPRFLLDTCEVDRAGPSYTVETLRELQAAEPDADWYLIIGQDQCANLPTWRDWEEIVARVHLAVACRGDEPVAVPAAVQARSPRITRLPLSPMTVSATDIRTRLQHGAPAMSLTPELVAEPVARYIANHQLYASGAPH